MKLTDRRREGAPGAHPASEKAGASERNSETAVWWSAWLGYR